MLRILLILFAGLIAACANADAQRPFAAEAIADFEEPWAMAFLPDGRLLVTEKPGRLLVVDRAGNKSQPISGLPAVDYGGQGGLGDVVLHPDFADNRLVYLTWSGPGEGGNATHLGRGRLEGSRQGRLALRRRASAHR